VTNYRPILLLTEISKVFETDVYHRLNLDFKLHNISTSEQYGFRKGVSNGNAN
jgi:hypothetical protein